MLSNYKKLQVKGVLRDNISSPFTLYNIWAKVHQLDWNDTVLMLEFIVVGRLCCANISIFNMWFHLENSSFAKTEKLLLPIKKISSV